MLAFGIIAGISALLIIALVLLNRFTQAPIALYVGIAIWAGVSLGILYRDVSAPANNVQPPASASKRAPLRSSGNSSNPYDFIFWGFAIIVLSYAIQKPTWANTIVDAIGAFKGKDINNAEELLIQHAIQNQDDREWAAEMILLIKDAPNEESDYNDKYKEEPTKSDTGFKPRRR